MGNNKNTNTKAITSDSSCRRQRPSAFEHSSGLLAVMLHPAASSVSAAALLVVGYIVLADSEGLQLAASLNLAVMVLFCGCYAAAVRTSRLPKLPVLSSKAQVLIRIGSILALAVELAYFGIPLLGHIPYNEFGWPVVHHLAAMQWVLVLFGKQHKKGDLFLTFVVGALLFNRQMVLFGVLAYLMTTPLPARKLIVTGLVAMLLMTLLGTLRNITLDVDTNSFSDVSSLSFAGPLFFIYLYLLGPLHQGMNLESEIWDTQLSLFWNTIPEWGRLAAYIGIPPSLSFILFYGIFSFFSYWMRCSDYWNLRVFGILIHIYMFFSFFSGVLLSTPIIGNFLAVAVAGLLYPRKAKTP